MRLRNITGADDMIRDSIYTVNDPKEYIGKWNSVFQRDGELHIEVGMGKGQFIHEMAKRNPHINYIGIEMYSSVLLRAIQKMELDPVTNLKFLCVDAKFLEEVFAEGEVDHIYLNFSDPWPKDRHAKRRLPSRQFLARFDKILKRDGKLSFKTDNRGLFDFALEELEPAGWKSEAYSFDLHNNAEMNEGNVMTEYEEKFSSKGNPICKYIIYR
ncbi:MAG: tRNA (guanosine(46)-N7)-methyltransferase TrmB [Lachnospiraceae bacterium]